MKKRVLFSIFVIAFLYLFSGSGFAQGVGGVNFLLAFPQGEFEQQVKHTGFGIGGEAVWSPHPGVFGIGLNLGYIIYGQETRRAPWSYTIPDVTVDVTRQNSIVNFHLLFKIMPAKGTIRPYLDLLAGGAYFFTTTTIEETYSTNDVATDVNFSDWAWSYGYGGGLMIMVSRDEFNQIFIDLKLRYLHGTEADYLKEGSVQVNQNTGTVIYNISTSKTDLLMGQIGVSVSF